MRKRVKNRFLTGYAKKNIRGIHALSSKYNGRSASHADKLLALVREHAREITELHEKGDAHFSVETGDLMVLCLELLLEKKAPVDEIMEKCYGRYRNKLQQLLKKSHRISAKGGKK